MDSSGQEAQRSSEVAKMQQVRMKRIYDEPGPEDGCRVLVDRVWPRGLSKERADIDEWLKQVAPSTGLRKWYGHDPDLYAEFTTRYSRELVQEGAADAFAHLRQLASEGALTLLTATRRSEISQASVLVRLLNTARGAEFPGH